MGQAQTKDPWGRSSLSPGLQCLLVLGRGGLQNCRLAGVRVVADKLRPQGPAALEATAGARGGLRSLFGFPMAGRPLILLSRFLSRSFPFL